MSLRPLLLATAALFVAGSVHAATALTLDDAIRLALERNQVIKVQSYNRPIARANVLTELGRFDPAITFRRTYGEDPAPAAGNGFTDDVLTSNTYSLALEGNTPWGMTYSLGGSAQRTGGIYNEFANQFSTFGGISITQPLLRGFGFGANLAGYRIAKADRGIADWLFKGTVIDTVTAVITAYSDLIYAQESLRISRRSRELAAGLVEENEKRFRVGSMSESDVMQARARTATRDQNVLLAEQNVRDATNRLRQLIGETAFPSNPEHLLLEPVQLAVPTVDGAVDLQTALNERPDYQAARLGVSKDRANRALARNQLLPRLDFVGSYGYNGLDPVFREAREQVADRENRSYAAGVVVSVPLTFAEGRGRARAAKLRLRQSEEDLLRAEQDIAVEVARAAGQIETAAKRVEANLAAYNLARQALDAELKKLRAGTSSTFLVLNLQEEQTYADLNYQASLADQRRAIAAYEQVLGRTLKTYGLSVAAQ